MGEYGEASGGGRDDLRTGARGQGMGRGRVFFGERVVGVREAFLFLLSADSGLRVRGVVLRARATLARGW